MRTLIFVLALVAASFAAPQEVEEVQVDDNVNIEQGAQVRQGEAGHAGGCKGHGGEGGGEARFDLPALDGAQQSELSQQAALDVPQEPVNAEWVAAAEQGQESEATVTEE